MTQKLEKSCTVDSWGFCGTHEQTRSKFQSKTFKKFEILKLQYDAMGYPFDGGSNEKK